MGRHLNLGPECRFFFLAGVQSGICTNTSDVSTRAPLYQEVENFQPPHEPLGGISNPKCTALVGPPS